MLRNQDITVPYDDTRRVQWDIDDVSGPNAGQPTPLGNRRVRWDLYNSNRDNTPFYALISDGDTLVIDDAENGLVSLYLDSEQTTLNISSGRYYLRVTEGEDAWTVATGKYTITR